MKKRNRYLMLRVNDQEYLEIVAGAARWPNDKGVGVPMARFAREVALGVSRTLDALHPPEEPEEPEEGSRTPAEASEAGLDALTLHMLLQRQLRAS